MGDWDLDAVARHDGRARKTVQIRSVVAQVADIYRITLATLDSGGDILAAHGRHHDVVSVIDGHAVAGQFLALEVEVEKIAAGRALGINALRSRYLLEHHFDVLAELLHALEIVTQDLDSDGGSDTCRQ